MMNDTEKWFEPWYWKDFISSLDKKEVDDPIYVMDNVPIDRETFISWSHRYRSQGYVPRVGDLVSAYGGRPSNRTLSGFPWGVVVEVKELTNNPVYFKSRLLRDGRARIALPCAMPRGAYVSDHAMIWEIELLTYGLILIQAASDNDNKEAA
jgi:hypothetical protein